MGRRDHSHFPGVAFRHVSPHACDAPSPTRHSLFTLAAFDPCARDSLAPDDAWSNYDITYRIQGCGWRMWLQIPVHVARFDLRWRIEYCM